MKCNIDAKGKAVRLRAGLITAAAAVLLFALWGSGVAGEGGEWILYTAMGTAAGAAFAIFEGWSGWCAIRAMGIKTKV